MSLTQDELARLEQLEDEQARGKSVTWDEPKSVRGVVVRDVENVTFKDDSGDEQTKRVVTLRTANGLETIWEGPVRLNERLFEGVRWKDDDQPLGPPRKGDLIVVNYRGDKPTAAGRNVKDFEVFRGEPTSSADEQTAIPEDAGPPEDPDDIPF